MQRILTIAGILFGITNSYATVWTDCSEAFDPVEIAAQTVTVPSPAEIDYKSGVGKEFREALAGRTDINWNAVRDNYREWSEHTTTLNGPARLLVACVLTVLTQGMGSEWLAGRGIAEGTAMQRALGAGIDAVVASAGTALAGNLGDIGKAFDELTSAASLKHLAATMVTAGTSLSLSNALNLPQSPETFTETLKSNTVAGLVRTGVDSAIVGGNVGQNLAKNMTSSAVDSTSAQLAHGIGSAHAEGKLGPLSHKLAHAGLGAASAALSGGDATAGAIGATVGEMAAESLHREGKDPSTTAAQARIIGDIVAFLARKDVASADKAGGNAVENNFLAHPELSMKIATAIKDESLSEEEKLKRVDEAIEIAKEQDGIYVATLGAAVAPALTAGYFASQSAAHWGGTYAGGGTEAIKQEFRDRPIASTLDIATAGMLGAGFAKGMAKRGVQIIDKRKIDPIYKPTHEQSALSLQYGFAGNKGSNIKANYEIDRSIPRYDRNTEHIVNKRRYGAHAMDQMQNRGIPPSVVENTITTGQKFPAKDGRLQYYDKTNNITVIAEPNGDIVTVRYGEK